VNIKIAGKWMFIPLKMVLIGIDPYPFSITYPLVVDWGYPSIHHAQRSGPGHKARGPGGIDSRPDMSGEWGWPKMNVGHMDLK
jgi:hypothetical protein